MPDWTKDSKLKSGQTTAAILWQTEWSEHTSMKLPEATFDDLVQIHDGVQTGHRVHTFGHYNMKSTRNGRVPHFISTRNGWHMHTDPGFVRYSHQLVLYNKSWRVTGLADVELPIQGPGAFYCIDTWSPHAVVPEERASEFSPYKLQAVIDSNEPFPPSEVVTRLHDLLTSAPKPHIAALK